MLVQIFFLNCVEQEQTFALGSVRIFKASDSSWKSSAARRKPRATRRSKNKLNQPFRKSNKGQNGLSYLGPKIWNNLHSDLKSAESVNSFKHKIKNKFFKDLQNQEDNPYEYY